MKHYKFVDLVIFTVIIVASLFSANKLFTNSFFTSHDGQGHVIRLEEFDNSLKENGAPVRIAKRINNGLGSYFFNFNYPGVYYLGEAFHLLGLNFVDSFKALLITSSILGGFGMYLFAKQYFNKLASLLSSLFYIFAPYKLLNMYVRGDVAEALGLCVLPLIFYSVKIQMVNKRKFNLPLVLSLALVILFHNITAMLSVFIVIVYFLLNLVQVKNTASRKHIIIGFLISLLIALGLTSFFWFPSLSEVKYTHLFDLALDYPDYFASFKEIIYSPWGFGLFKLGSYPGKMSPQLGLANSFVLFLVVISLVLKRKYKDEYIYALFFVGLAFVSIFLATNYSHFIWEKISFLRLVQIPWRFVGYTVFSTSFLVGYILNLVNNSVLKSLIFVFLGTLLIYSIRNDLNVNSYVKFSDPFIYDTVFGGNTTSKSEHTPIWSPQYPTDKFKPDGNFVSGKGSSQRIIWEAKYHLFDVTVVEDGEFVDNTNYFPGWIAKVDDRDVKINYDGKSLGRLGVFLTKGQHKVEYVFTETSTRLVSDVVSFFALGLVVLFLLTK